MQNNPATLPGDSMEALRKHTHNLLLFVLLLTGILVFALLFQQKTVAQKQMHSASVPTPSNQQSIASQMQSMPPTGTLVYGKSGLGANLNCVRILPDGPIKAALLMTFEIHGYEDAFPKDGQVLVNIGNAVAQWAASNRAVLGNMALYIVPSANPDGLSNGESNNGKGRCQISLGVNINRDFPTDFHIIPDARDHTLSAPLAAPESQALVDLVTEIKPTVVIDVHGWEDHILGDAGVASYFLPATTTKINTPFDAKCAGFFSLWASTQGARADLLELPQNATVSPDYYTSKIEAGITELTHAIVR